MGRISPCCAAFAVSALLAGCTSGRAPEPAAGAAPAPPAAVAPPPVLRALPPSSDWRDADLTAGTWFHDGASARFVAADGAAFVLRCDSAARRVLLEREGVAGEMTIRTTGGDRRFSEARAPLPAGDSFLDSIVFSRGRFVVETAGKAMVIPAWPEPARTIEDCRS